MSFFNSALSSDDEDDTGASLFSHSNRYLEVAKEKLEREKRSAEKAKAKAEQKKIKSEGKERKTSVKRESDGSEKSGSPKRTRIDAEESKKLLAKATAGFSIDISDDSDEETPTPVPGPKPRRSPRSQRTRDALSPRKPESKMDSAISLTLDDEDDFEITNIKQTVAPPPPPDEDEDSDPELAAIKRRARERRKAQQQGAHPTAASISPGVEDGSGQMPAPPPPDPTVQILVTSEIPDTTPLICCRKISQNLEPVREAWIGRQGALIPPSMAPTVYFTHRGKRVYNTTLIRRLGVAVDTLGRAYLEDDPDAEGPAKVHVEAVTPELFQKQEAERARAAAEDSKPVQPESAGQEGEEEDVQEEDEPQIRIIIKAKDKRDMKLIVKPSTLISKIIKNARKNMKFEESQNLYIEFDGDRLNPDDKVGDTEIEDMMGLDLYVGN